MAGAGLRLAVASQSSRADIATRLLDGFGLRGAIDPALVEIRAEGSKTRHLRAVLECSGVDPHRAVRWRPSF